MRRLVTAAGKNRGSMPGASARISHGAPRMTAAATAVNTHTRQRFSLRKSAVRSAPAQAVSMGTKAKTTLLIITELSVSIGPMATASESAWLCVPRKDAVRATRPKPRMLPVSTPSTSVRPPRTKGLSTARASAPSVAGGGGRVELSRTSATQAVAAPALRAADSAAS